MLSHDPFDSRKNLRSFKEEAQRHFNNEQDLNNLCSVFKFCILLDSVVTNTHNLSHKSHIQGLIYDTMNSIVSTFLLRERYLYLNIRSVIENIARIALSKSDGGDAFDGTVRRKDFMFLKENKPNENWKFMHETYIRACAFVHLSPQSGLNISSTFKQLVADDHQTNPTKQILNLQKILSSVMRIFLVYFKEEVSTVYFRAQADLQFVLGRSLYKFYQELIG